MRWGKSEHQDSSQNLLILEWKPKGGLAIPASFRGASRGTGEIPAAEEQHKRKGKGFLSPPRRGAQVTWKVLAPPGGNSPRSWPRPHTSGNALGDLLRNWEVWGKGIRRIRLPRLRESWGRLGTQENGTDK